MMPKCLGGNGLRIGETPSVGPENRLFMIAGACFSRPGGQAGTMVGVEVYQDELSWGGKGNRSERPKSSCVWCNWVRGGTFGAPFNRAGFGSSLPGPQS